MAEPEDGGRERSNQRHIVTCSVERDRTMPAPSLDDFAAVARERSSTRAAAALGTSVSNLSHTVRRAEARLGHQLLERNSRSLAVKEAGERLLAAIRPALDGITTALDALEQGRDTVSGTLRLIVTLQASDAVLRPVLPRFTPAHPAATIAS
jgi:DNA-binding transcriptional LysR family regulator